MLSTFAFSQHNGLEKVTQNGQDFYLYEVKDKEGLYRISKSFDISQEEIIEFNPEAIDGVKKGEILRIPMKSMRTMTKKQSGDFITHIVEKGETIFSISKKHKITQNDLLKNNPSVINGLAIGVELKIPVKTPTYKEHIVQPKETLYGISRSHEVSADEINKLNPELKEGLKIGQTIKIPLKEIPLAASAFTEENTSQSKPTTIGQFDKFKTIKIALLLPFMLNNENKQDATIDKFIEFYEGFLLGIEQMKSEGISVQLSTFDIEKTEEKVKEVLTLNPSIKQADLIVGPAYSTQINVVTEFARANKIAVVIPFSSHVENILDNPYILQYNAPKAFRQRNAANLFCKKFADKNIIVMKFNNDAKDLGSDFAEVLKGQLSKNRIEYTEILFTQENFANIKNSFTKGKETILVLGTDKPILVRELLPQIGKQNTKETPVSIFGFSNWEKTLESYTSTYYCTPFSIDIDSKEYALYRERFRQEFGYPSPAMPRFDLMGYELSTFFIKAIYSKGNNYLETIATAQQNYELQSKLSFKKVDERGGYINDGIYLMHNDKVID